MTEVENVNTSKYTIEDKEFSVSPTMHGLLKRVEASLMTAKQAIMEIVDQGRIDGLPNFQIREIVDAILGKYSQRMIVKALPKDLKRTYTIEEKPAKTSTSELSSEVDAKKSIEDTSSESQEEKPVWHDWDKDEKDRLIEAARADTESIRNHRDKIADELRELKEKSNNNEQLEKDRDHWRDKFHEKESEFLRTFADKTAFKAASQITPQESLLSENKALKIENEILKKREITFENEPLELPIPDFYEDLLVLTLPKNRGKAAKITHDGKRVIAIGLWKKEVKS